MQPAGRAVLWLIAGSTLVRILLAWFLDPNTDETYTYVCSLTPDFCFHDHPPLSVWLSWIGLKLTGDYNFISLRWPHILLFSGSTWLIYLIGRDLFSPRAGLYGAWFLNLSFLIVYLPGLLARPDSSLVFFWLATAYLLVRIFFGKEPKRSNLLWLGVGVGLGLAGLGKYNAALFPPGLVLFLATTPRLRFWLRQPQPYLAGLACLMVLAPVLWWNHHHGWASFVFQASRVSDGLGFSALNMVYYLFATVFHFLPWIWILCIRELGRGILSGPKQEGLWFCTCISCVPILFFLGVSGFNKGTLTTWTLTGYLLLFPALGQTLALARGKGRAWPRNLAVSLTAVMVLCSGLATVHSHRGWLDPIVEMVMENLENMAEPEIKLMFSPAFDSNRTLPDPVLDHLDYRELEKLIEGSGMAGTPGFFVFSDHRTEAGRLAWTLRSRIPSLCLGSKPLHFAYPDQGCGIRGGTGLGVFWPQRLKLRVGYRAPLFESVEDLGELVIHRGGKPRLIRRVILFRNMLRPYPLPYGVNGFAKTAKPG